MTRRPDLAVALWLAPLAGGGELPVPSQEPGRVRDLAREILARPEYDEPAEPLPAKVQRWFSELIGRVLENLVGSGAGTVLAWAILAAAIGGTVLLIVRASGGLQRDPGAPPRVVMVELTKTPAEWRADADRLEDEGDWKGALRCRYRGLIGDLVRRDVIPEMAGRTGGEYVRDVRASLPAVAEHFAGATVLFELAWYGDRPTGPQQSERFRELEARVLGRELVS